MGFRQRRGRRRAERRCRALISTASEQSRRSTAASSTTEFDSEITPVAGRICDLAAVVGRLGLHRFALGGVDIGAATAIAYAVENHAAVSRLVLLSPWASGARYLQIPALRAAYSAEASGEPEWKLFANILASVASGFKDPDFVQKGTEAFLQTTSPSALSAFNAANARIDITELLPRVAVPTLVTHRGRGSARPEKHSLRAISMSISRVDISGPPCDGFPPMRRRRVAVGRTWSAA